MFSYRPRIRRVAPLLVVLMTSATFVGPLTARSYADDAPQTVPVTIDPVNMWTDAGITLNAGDQVSISASGLINIYGSPPTVGNAGTETPNGEGSVSGTTCNTSSGPVSDNFPLSGVPCWSLIAKVADSPTDPAPLFFVGTNGSFTATTSGKLLFLGPNDGFLGDNTGVWNALVTKYAAPPPPPPSAPESNRSAPTAPQDVTVTVRNHSVSVSFTAPAYNGSNEVTRYVAKCVSADGKSSGTGSGTFSPIIVTGLLNGVAYTCTVSASNVNGMSPLSDPSGPVTPEVIVTCESTHTCDATTSTLTSPNTPPEIVNVTGTPIGSTGTVEVNTARAQSNCPGLPPIIAPVTTLQDSGFSAGINLTVTVTQLAVGTSGGRICYTKNGHTVLLPLCPTVANVAPCQVSSTQTSTSVVVVFLVPVGDPTFRLVLPAGRLLWPSSFPAGKVGVAYASRMQSSGGKAPFHWKVASGKLPAGLALNPSTGAITGKPKARGVFSCVVNSTDSESPPKSANIGVSLTIK